MNTAARIQSAAPVDGVLVGELTYVATRDAIDYRDAEPIAAKGKSEPVRVWEAVEVKEEAHMPAADAVTFVGREREASALTEVWSTAIAEHRPGLVDDRRPAGNRQEPPAGGVRAARRARTAASTGGDACPTARASRTGRSRRSSSRPPGSSRATTATTIAGRLDDFLKTTSDRRPRRAADDRGGTVEPDRQPDDSARHVRHRRRSRRASCTGESVACCSCSRHRSPRR